MVKRKEIDLIKLEVLGCISEEDSQSLQTMKETEKEFPWKELAKYQKLVSLLPSTLNILYPGSDLKDKTAKKLYDIRDEIKGKVEAKKASLIPVDENTLSAEEPVLEVKDDIQFQEEEIALSQTEKFQIKEIPTITKKTESENLLDDIETEDVVLAKDTLDIELNEKPNQDRSNASYEIELETIKNSVKRNMVLSITFFLITLALIAILFFIK